MKIIYLTGPITGNQTDWTWRAEATEKIEFFGGEVIDPLDGVDPGDLDKEGLWVRGDMVPTETAEGDSCSIEEADIVFANIEYRPTCRDSIGTWWELGEANRQDKVIIIRSTLDFVMFHPFPRAFAHTLTRHWDEAIEAIKVLIEGE